MPTSLGPAEILVILIVALIVLGPKKLPEAGRQVGRAIAEVRKWSQGFQDEIRTVIDPNVAPSYQPPVGTDPAVPLTPLPVPGSPPGPASPADAEYTGPIPETVPPVVVGPAGPAVTPDPDGSGEETAPPASTNGDVPGPAVIEPSEPPAGEPPRS